MDVRPLGLPGLLLISPPRHQDARGFLSEAYRDARYRDAGIDAHFVQDNISWSADAGTVRGLHFQRPPGAQAKLVQVLRGALLDVVVDLRRGSPTYGRHETVELSAETGRQLFVPVGFAHGLCTLRPDTLVFYKVSHPYSAADDAGIAWDDPDLGIAWPVARDGAILSDKDRRLPRMADLGDIFP